MATIEELRKQIDQIDSEIMELLDKRYHLTTQIGDIKATNKTAVLDSNREELIYNKTAKFRHSPQIKEIYKTIMTESKALQRK